MAVARNTLQVQVDKMREHLGRRGTAAEGWRLGGRVAQRREVGIAPGGGWYEGDDEALLLVRCFDTVPLT